AALSRPHAEEPAKRASRSTASPVYPTCALKIAALLGQPVDTMRGPRTRRTAMILNWHSKLSALPRCLLFGGLAATASWAVGAPSARAEESTAQITVLYDAFGKTSSMQKDWGFSALIEYGGKRILFDTGNNAEIFAHNVAAKGIDLTTLDFAIVSHRHCCHTSGLNDTCRGTP